MQNLVPGFAPVRINLLLLCAAAGRATDVTGDGNEPIGAYDEVDGPEPE